MATRPGARPRGVRSRRRCRSRPTTRRCRSCSCRPSTTPTATSARSGATRSSRRSTARCRCPSTCVREVAPPGTLSTAEGRAKALFDARPLVKALPAGALRMQIVRSLATLSGASPEEILDSFQIRATTSISRRSRPRRVDRQPPQGLAQRALVALIKYPMHARTLTASDLATLEAGAGDARDLIVEIVEVAKGEGHDVDFLAMSDALRESANREVYEALMQDVLSDDETKRDLLVAPDGTDDERQTVRRREQTDAAAQELTRRRAPAARAGAGRAARAADGRARGGSHRRSVGPRGAGATRRRAGPASPGLGDLGRVPDRRRDDGRSAPRPGRHVAMIRARRRDTLAGCPIRTLRPTASPHSRHRQPDARLRPAFLAARIASHISRNAIEAALPRGSSPLSVLPSVVLRPAVAVSPVA